MYLGEAFGVAAQLYPAPGPARGEAMKWITWTSVTLHEAANRLSAARPSESAGAVQPGSPDWVPPAQRSAATLHKAQADVTACLHIVNAALEGKPFLLGNYSLADTHLQGIIGWITSMDVDLSAHPNVSAWHARCSQRPALAALADA
jgi:glutathione S-transferase